jgi:uncharacterized protein YcbK (DUF882 family)
MGDLSRNFSRKELECPCCGSYIENKELVDLLQAIRDFAGRPVVVSSGTRCAKRNASLKNSASNSGHLTGEAADIRVDGWTKKELGIIIKKIHSEGKIPQLTYCYLIADGNRAVHVGVDKRYRRNVFAF